MPQELNFLTFSVSVIGPVMVLIAFGYGLYKYGSFDDAFVDKASSLVFNFALPALLFSTISKSSIGQFNDFDVILSGLGGTLFVFVLLTFITPYIVLVKADRGVVIQGAFRSNMGIIGLAYSANAFGSEGIAYASIYLGVMTILYNLLSVVVLNVYLNAQTSMFKIVKDIAKNPIIIAIALGVAVSSLSFSLPNIVTNSIDYFAQLTLPLALLCTGAALRFSTMRQNSKAGVFSILMKCVVYPFVLVGLAVLLGIDGMPLMIIFLMSSCPTAAASYVMVRKIGGNHQLAAQIIAVSTVLSVPFTLAGFAIMSAFL